MILLHGIISPPDTTSYNSVEYDWCGFEMKCDIILCCEWLNSLKFENDHDNKYKSMINLSSFVYIFSCVAVLSWVNPLLHSLIVDHDLVFYFQTTLKKIKKKLSFEYFWKYYWKWSICSKRANAPFSIIFWNAWYFKGVKSPYYGVKYLTSFQQFFGHFTTIWAITIDVYGCDGHLGHVTRTVCMNFHSPILRSLRMKIEFNWLSGF